MRPWLALCVGLAACCWRVVAQDDAEAVAEAVAVAQSEPCRHGCDDDDLVALPSVPRRAERSVPVSLIATGMLSRRSALENNFMRFGRSAPPGGPSVSGSRTAAALVQEASGLRAQRADNFMRFGRSPQGVGAAEGERVARGGDHNSNGFIRFGRTSKDNYMRFGRGGDGTAKDDNYVRFGRPDKQSNFVRFGRDPSNFVRFGRGGSDSNFVRFGRGGSDSNFVRFGRGGSDSNFVRFGRGGSDSNFVRFGRAGAGGELEADADDQDEDVQRDARSKDNYMRFGRAGASGLAEAGDGNATDKGTGLLRATRAKDSFMRFGRDKTDFMRFGRAGRNNFVRLGRSYIEEDDSAEAGETEGEAARQEAQDGSSSRTKRPQGM